MRLRNVLGITVLLAAATATGLTQAQTAKKVVTIAVYPDLDSVIKAVEADFEKANPDIDLRLNQPLGHGEHHTALTTSLATNKAMADVVAVDVGYIGRFSEGNALVDLAKPPYNALQYRAAFTPYTYAQAITDDGRMIAMPVDIGPGTLYYRQDLIAKAGLTEADLTKSWESYLAAGKKLKAQGVMLVGNATSVAEMIWKTNVPGTESVYFAKDLKTSIVDNPRFTKAFNTAREIRSQGLDGKIGEWSAEWGKGFQDSKIATQAMGAWLVGHFQNWLDKDNKGKWRATNLPEGGFASWGGSFYAIPSASTNKDAAWRVIRYLTTNQSAQVAALKVTGAFPALLAAQRDPVFEQPIEYLGGQKARTMWRTAASKTPALEVSRFDDFARDTLFAELELVFGGKDVKQALADAKALIERRSRR